MSAHNPQLAIVIPTYRWDALAKDALIHAAAIGSQDIVVHIGDNSANPEKHAFLDCLAARSVNVKVTCHATNIGADANWLYLIKAQTAPFICMAADDDSFASAYYRCGVALIRDDPECATASGLHVTVAHVPDKKKPVVSIAGERREPDPLQRIRNYSGENSICYSISRLPVIQKFASYIEANPLQCPFNDYMLAFHLLSMGTYRLDHKGYAYIFDNSHWKLHDAFISSNSRWYKGYDLPETFGYLTRLHWSVVAVHFFSSVFRSPNLSDRKAEAIVSYLFHRQRTEFAADYYRQKSMIDALFEGRGDAAAACSRLMTSNYQQIASIFDDFAIVVDVFSPDIARRYRAFQTATLQAHAYAIKPTPILLTGLAKARATAGNVVRLTFGH